MTQIKKGLTKSPSYTHAMRSQQDDRLSRDKKPSDVLMNLIKGWTDSYIKSTELPVKILEQAEKEGFTKAETRTMIEIALVNRGLSERRIRQVLPEELKEHSKVRAPSLRQSTAAKDPDNDEPSEAEKKFNEQLNEDVPVTHIEDMKRNLPVEQVVAKGEQAQDADDEGDLPPEIQAIAKKVDTPTFTKEYTNMDTCVFRMGLKKGIQTPEEGMLREMTEYVTKQFPFMRQSGWKTIEVTIRVVV